MESMLKKLLFANVILFSLSATSQTENKLDYKEYSYAEFFKMIEEEKDSIFTLENAIVKYNQETDSIHAAQVLNFSPLELSEFRKEKIKINKELKLTNIQFLPHHIYDSINNINFTPIMLGFINLDFLKPITINNVSNLIFFKCNLKESVTISDQNNGLVDSYNDFRNLNLTNYTPDIYILSNHFQSNFRLDLSNFDIEEVQYLDVNIENNQFYGDYSYFRANWIYDFVLNKNSFISKIRPRIVLGENQRIELKLNTFDNWLDLHINSDSTNELIITENNFAKNITLDHFKIPVNSKIDWSQWANKIVLDRQVTSYSISVINVLDSINVATNFFLWNQSQKRINDYLANAQIKLTEHYREEVKFRNNFYKYYKESYNLENANLVYTEIKDLETKRSEHLYRENPSFDTFFTWKINQFLKVFSAYGTKPSRAIIISLYVILFFAFIYLLFPNSWDTLGKKRLIHRFDFFQKYLKREDGMHTLYLEDKQQELSTYKDFKDNIENSKLELPSFFVKWSKPLYNASMFSSKFTTKVLKSTDILHGKWSDLSPKQKRWKNIQIGTLLTLGLLFDFFIKALNALMLSINTFTTLGFGEIPIKGLPRYLAILQGFIGWFMLTIFSVSLISQLLN